MALQKLDRGRGEEYNFEKGYLWLFAARGGAE